jgi:uncharacterized BrkB/YihY/UPF0761 family membrane protein
MRDGPDDGTPPTLRERGAALAELGRHAALRAEERVPGAPALVESLRREQEAASGLLAGGLAFRFFLWLVPFGLVVAAITSFWVESDPEAVESAARDFGLAGAAARSARVAIEEGAHSKWYLLGAGLVLLVWFGMSAARALYIAFRIAWADPTARLRNPLRASVVFGLVATGLVAISAAERIVDHETGALVTILTMVAVGALYVVVAVGVMSLLPHRDAPTEALVPGAIGIAVGMNVVKVIVVVYLAPNLEDSPDLYGALGAATVFLLWLYFVARLIVSAAFLNATLWDRRRRADG